MLWIRRLFILAFWGAALFAYAEAVMPAQQSLSLTWWDKLNHAIAFFVITLLGRAAYPHLRVVAWLALMGAFGAFIEISQAVPIVHRDANMLDWIADMIATGAALIVAWPIAWWEKRKERRLALAEAKAPGEL